MYEDSQEKQAGLVAKAPISASPIEAALGSLHENINILDECVANLRSRASSVIGPSKTSDTAGPACAPTPYRSACAPTTSRSATWNSINSASDRISSLCAEIRDLTSSLET